MSQDERTPGGGTDDVGQGVPADGEPVNSVPDQSMWGRFWHWVINDPIEMVMTVFLLLVLPMLVVFVFRYMNASIDSEGEVRQVTVVVTATPAEIDESLTPVPSEGAALVPPTSFDAQEVLERADNAVWAADRATENTNTILSFLEGAGFIIALALGAAAMLNIRAATKTREDLEGRINQEVSEIQDVRREVRNELDRLRDDVARVTGLREQLAEEVAQTEQLNDRLRRIDEIEASVKTTLEDSITLSMVFQEFALNNHRQAYALLEPIQARNPENVYVLYLSGWIELNDDPEVGLKHLQEAFERAPNWPSAEAAYGVALRRIARNAGDEGLFKLKVNRLEAACERLRHALEVDGDLLDPNREPYWGTLGGILRDLGELEQALAAYEEGLRIAPSSSYLLGNRSALRLRLFRDEPKRWSEVLDSFTATLRASQYGPILTHDDYYTTMDRAMSLMMLGRRDETDFEQAHIFLQTAVDLPDATLSRLKVSLTGWENLLEFCPEDQDGVSFEDQPVSWSSVRENLEQAIVVVNDAIKTKKTTETGDEEAS